MDNKNMQAWKYQLVRVPINEGRTLGFQKSPKADDLISKHLSAQGDQGWELVQILDNELPSAYVLVMKRPKP